MILRESEHLQEWAVSNGTYRRGCRCSGCRAAHAAYAKRYAETAARPGCVIDGCSKPAQTRGWCGMHYSRWLRHGMPSLDRLDLPRDERHLRRIIRLPNGCWLWTGRRDSAGYGTLTTDGGRDRAHRWSYRYHRGEIPPGLWIDHLCRVEVCVNPWHLEPVTPRENSLRGARYTLGSGPA